MSETTSTRQAAHTKERAQYVSKSIKWAHRMLWVDLVLYVVFLLTFLLAALAPFVSVAWDGHMLINIFSKYANTLEWPDPSNTFQDIHSVADFWSWWRGPFRAILLGLDPYSQDEPLIRRPGHVNGTLLNNVVVGTVRLRQQRARIECNRRNQLNLPQAAMLCYAPDIWDGAETADWAWPRFLATTNETDSLPDGSADTGNTLEAEAPATQAQRRRHLMPQKLTGNLRDSPGGRISLDSLRHLLQTDGPAPVAFVDSSGSPTQPAAAAAAPAAATAPFVPAPVAVLPAGPQGDAPSAPGVAAPPPVAEEPPVDADAAGSGALPDAGGAPVTVPAPAFAPDAGATAAPQPVVDPDLGAPPTAAPTPTPTPTLTQTSGVGEAATGGPPLLAPVAGEDVAVPAPADPVADGEIGGGASVPAPVAPVGDADADDDAFGDDDEDDGGDADGGAAVVAPGAGGAAAPGPAGGLGLGVDVVAPPDVVEDEPEDAPFTSDLTGFIADTTPRGTPQPANAAAAPDSGIGSGQSAAPAAGDGVAPAAGVSPVAVAAGDVDDAEDEEAGVGVDDAGDVSEDGDVAGEDGDDVAGVEAEDGRSGDDGGSGDDGDAEDVAGEGGETEVGVGQDEQGGGDGAVEEEEAVDAAGGEVDEGDGSVEVRVAVTEEEAEQASVEHDRRRRRRDDDRRRVRPEEVAATTIQDPPVTDDGSGGDNFCANVDADSVWLFGGSLPNRTCEKILAEKEEFRAKTPAFKHRTHSQLSSAVYTSKTSLRMFDGSGYAHDFDVKNSAAFDDITDLLASTSWVDAATRFVVVEMTLYSPATDLVAAVFFMVEVHGSGLAESRIGYEAFRLQYYSHYLGWGRLAVELLFVCLCIAIFIADLAPVILKRESTIRQHWSRNPFFWMSVLMMGTTLTIVGLRIHNVHALAAFDPADIAPGTDAFGSHFAKLHGPSSRVRIERSLGALLSFCVWLRIFKYTRSVPVFGTIGRTITRAFPAIVTFLLMSAVVFLGFAQSFFLGFYVSNEGFQSMLESVMSMLRFTTGDVDYEALNRTNTVLAPLLYTLSLFVLGFVWTSLLLAIVINAYYDEVNDEGAFEFDKDFPNFSIANPLLRKHKEWDEAAMTGANETPFLTPDLYNRFVVNSLARFDHSVPMVSMTMAQFLLAARNGRVPGHDGDLGLAADGETLPIGHRGRCASHHHTPSSPRFLVPSPDGDGVGSPRYLTDSEHIVVRFGQLKGVRKVYDTHALYFPKELDEHRCRAWWELHKHHLRVGDAAVRYIKKQAPRDLVSAIRRPLAPIGRIAQPGQVLLGSLHFGSRRTHDTVSQGDGDGIGTQASIGSGSSPAQPGRRSFAFYRNSSKPSRGRPADVGSERSDDAATTADSGGVSRSWSLNGMIHSHRSSRNNRAFNRSTSNTSAAPSSPHDADNPTSAAASAARPVALAAASDDASASCSPESPHAGAAAADGAYAPRSRRRQAPPPSDSGSPMPMPLELPDTAPAYPPSAAAGQAGPARLPNNVQAATGAGEHDSLLDWASPLGGGMEVIPEVTEALTHTMEFPPSSITSNLAAPGAHVSRRLADGLDPGVVWPAGGASTSTTDIMSGLNSPLVHGSAGIDEMSASVDGTRSSGDDSTVPQPLGTRPTSHGSAVGSERRR